MWCFGSDILGKLILESVELLFEYLVSLLVILMLMFFCVFWVDFFMCGVKIMLLNFISGDLNGFLFDAGFFGNMLIVVFVIWLDLSVLYRVGILIIVLWVVLMKIVFGFMCVNFFVFIIFLVLVVFGICSDMILYLLSSLFKVCIWVVLLSESLFLML